MNKKTTLFRGAVSELIVEKALLESGFYTFTPSHGLSAPIDIIAYKNGVIKKIQVKTGCLSTGGYRDGKGHKRQKNTVRVTLTPGGGVGGLRRNNSYKYEEFIKQEREYDVLAMVYEGRIAWVDDKEKINGHTSFCVQLNKVFRSHKNTKYFHEYENPDWLKA
tara:strand:- start:1200 stop:1688 length:489 start_codon:yes stop_codon:yes gene_type:complete